MAKAPELLAEATVGTPWEGRVWLVGGAVRDDLLGLPETHDFDFVLESSAIDLADWCFEQGLSEIAPVVYPRFGTALIRIAGADVELVTARSESYEAESRKPKVETASLAEDALRRDFTVNTLLRNLHTAELADPLGCGLADLEAKVLRTPLDPAATFQDDPLRMLRAVRFRWQIGFDPAPGLFEAIADRRDRLHIVSAERIRDELVRMLELDQAHRCLVDLMDTGLLEVFAPELVRLKGVEQGSFHHLDAWEHTLLALQNLKKRDLMCSLAVLLHDVGKPATRSVDDEGRTRFFGHESLGAEIARAWLHRMRFPNDVVDAVSKVVHGHMRFHQPSRLSDSAIRRLVRDFGETLPTLLDVVEADASALRPGVRSLDLTGLRSKIATVQAQVPVELLVSPLDGAEIMVILGIRSGPAVGRAKAWLTDQVLDGSLPPGDKEQAKRLLLEAKPKWEQP